VKFNWIVTYVDGELMGSQMGSGLALCKKRTTFRVFLSFNYFNSILSILFYYGTSIYLLYHVIYNMGNIKYKTDNYVNAILF